MKIEYKNIYVHYIFTVLHRKPLILEKNKERLEKYITGIVTHQNSRLYSIYANPEHVHFLVSISPNITIEYLASIVANSSENFINNEKLCSKSFSWQQSAAAYSVSKKDIEKVCNYILNQKEHHRKISYQEECEMFLKVYLKKTNYE